MKIVIQWEGGGGGGGGRGGGERRGRGLCLMDGMYWGDFSTSEEMIRFLKHIVQKPTQVNIPNLFNS